MNKISSFDGLRALAVVAVMLVHIGFPGFVLGGLGVDLFFALSGFLITHLFFREYHSAGSLNLFHFWARRFLRLMPIYWLYISLITALVLSGFGQTSHYAGWTISHYLWSMWLYFINYLPSGGLWTEQFLTIHLWSLAVEEQFYLIWPLVAIFLFRRGWVLQGVCYLLVLCLVYYFFLAEDIERLKTLTGRGITIFIGCFFAVLCNDPRFKRYFTLLSATYLVLFIGALLVLFSAGAYLEMYTEKYIKVNFSIFYGFLFSWLIACLYHQQGTISHRILEMPILVYLGKISYGIYLYHLAVQKIVWEWLYVNDIFYSSLDYLLRTTIYFVLTFIIATISFYTVESYFLRYKDKFRT